MGTLAQPHWEAVSHAMRGLLGWVGDQAFSPRFYLARGTALALQLGHRPSVDLDFFSEADEVHEPTRREIIRTAASRNGEVLESSDGNLVLLLDGVRTGFFSYGYPLLEPALSLQSVNLAGLLDIGLMKLDALMSRGSRKDFYDLFAVCQRHPIEALLLAGEKKYPHMRDFALMAVESMIQFDNADREAQPELLAEVPWRQVRGHFLNAGKTLLNRWFRE